MKENEITNEECQNAFNSLMQDDILKSLFELIFVTEE